MKKTIVTVTDDLDGSEGADTVQFGLDGNSYLIDLSDDNADRLRDALAPYIKVAQKVGRLGAGPRPAAKPTQRAGREQNQAIREWAANNGYSISERGRIPSTITEAYRAAA